MSDPSPLHQTALPSGRRVVTDALPGAASCCVVAMVGVGGRDEPAEVAGASHFLEHLLCRGSDDRPATEVAEAVDACGGELDAVTDRERTVVSLRVPADALDFATDLLGDLVLHPALRADEVEVERRVILEELARAIEDAEDRAHTLAAAAVYGDHPLGREVIGDGPTLRRLGPDRLGAFHAEHYGPGGMVVAASGAVDHDRFVERVARWDTGPAPSGVRGGRRAPIVAPPSTVVRRQSGEQVHLVLAWPLGRLDDGARRAMTVAAHILGGGPASRLFRSVRDDHGLAYAVEASVEVHSDGALLTAYAACSPSAVGRVRDLIVAEVDDLATRGPSDHDVEVAVGYVAGSTTLAHEHPATRAGWAAYEALERGGARPAAERIADLRAVGRDEVVAAARRWSAPPTVVAVGPVPRRVRL